MAMNFFVNKAIGYSNSGVEHAQFYRAQCFREKKYHLSLFLQIYYLNCINTWGCGRCQNVK
ncbi:hypothetical protein GCM10025879_13050 [Leuconostoc litchii]|nr:hypothetical protein GCM10025879_13050 [Leuconostoc litchii]